MYNNGRFCADEGTKEWVKRWLNYSLDGLVFAASFTHDTRPKGSTSVFLCRAQREFRKKRQPPSLTTSYFRYDRSSSSSSSSFPLVDTFFFLHLLHVRPNSGFCPLYDSARVISFQCPAPNEGGTPKKSGAVLT